MFDIGAAELLVIVIVAVIVIGPKELPLALRTAGRWIGKIRRVSTHFRTGLDAMIREAEMEEMDRKWKEQNERIMAKYPADEGVVEKTSSQGLQSGDDGHQMEALDQPSIAAVPADGNAGGQTASDGEKSGNADEPPLPFERPADKG